MNCGVRYTPAMDAWIPLTIIGLYAAWQALGWNRQRTVLAHIWAFILCSAMVGVVYSCSTTGALPVPTEYPW